MERPRVDAARGADRVTASCASALRDPASYRGCRSGAWRRLAIDQRSVHQARGELCRPIDRIDHDAVAAATAVVATGPDGTERLIRNARAVIDENHVAAGDADVTDPATIGRRQPCGKTHRERQGIGQGPFDVHDRLVEQRIGRVLDLGQPHCTAMMRIGVGRVAGRRPEHFLEDQYVSGRKPCGRGHIRARRRCRSRCAARRRPAFLHRDNDGRCWRYRVDQCRAGRPLGKAAFRIAPGKSAKCCVPERAAHRSRLVDRQVRIPLVQVWCYCLQIGCLENLAAGNPLHGGLARDEVERSGRQRDRRAACDRDPGTLQSSCIR
jgi:hypothetical protein